MTKKNVLLVSLNILQSPFPIYPVALSRLAGVLEDNGHKVFQCDLLIHSLHYIISIIQHENINIIGLSLRNVDTTDICSPHSFVEHYKNFVQNIKPFTNSIPIILGGSAFTLFPKEYLDILSADGGCIGAGDGVFSDVVNKYDGTIDSIKEINNFITKNTLEKLQKNMINSCDFILNTSYNKEIVSYYWEKSGMIGIQTKRGCTHACSYCTYPQIDGHKIQYASHKNVVDDIEKLYKEHGINYFFMADSLFNINKDYELILAQELINRKLNIEWGGFFIPQKLDEYYLSTMQKSGLKHIEFGTDSLSPIIMKELAKTFTFEEVLNVCKICHKLNLHVAHYLLFGSISETEQTVIETLNRCLELPEAVFFVFLSIRAFPQTPLYQKLKQNTATQITSCFSPIFIKPQNLCINKLEQIIKQAIGNRTNWIFPDNYLQLNKKMLKLRKLGFKGPLWEFILNI